jgi:Sulfotransferase family
MISHHYKCIFIHIPKTAGQSIEHVFLKLLDLDWETRAPLLLRYNDNPELGPPRLAHLKAREYVPCKYLTQEQFDDYFKFAFVRNPWDRMVSIYKYFRWNRYVEFKTFVVKKLTRIWQDSHWFIGPQSDFVCNENGEIIVDFVGKFETLDADFNKVCRHLGLPPTELPYVNKSAKQNVRLSFNPKDVLKYARWLYRNRTIPSIKPAPGFKNYHEYYDDECRELVADLYKKDIQLFGYEFN